MRDIRNPMKHTLTKLFSLLLVGVLSSALMPVQAQDVPTDGLLLRLHDLDNPEAVSELDALDASLEHATPYTAAVVHPHDGRMSVTISQGRLEKSLSGFVREDAAEVFVYDRILDGSERSAIKGYVSETYDDSVREGPGGLAEGIQVKGGWSIEVRDLDGTLVERQDFENALATPSGPELLSGLFTGQTVPGDISVRVFGDESAQDPCESSGSRAGCVMTEGSGSNSATYVFNTLSVSTPSSGDHAHSIVLTGSFKAGVDGNVGIVQSHVDTCGPSATPNDCQSTDQLKLTGTLLSSPVAVEAGQQVSVEVIISFN